MPLSSRNSNFTNLEWPLVSLILVLSLMTFMRNLHWKDELTIWARVLEDSPLKWRPHFKVWLAFFSEGRLPRAVEKFNRALELNPDAYDIHTNIGVSYQRMGLLDEAEKEYMLVMEKGTRSAAYLNLGTLYVDRRDPEMALEWFLKAVDLKPRNTSALINAGFTYGDLGEYRKAVEMHNKVISINPYLPNAHYGLGLAYEGLGQYDKAVFHWREYLRLAPESLRWRVDAQRHLLRLRPLEEGRR
jgi:tetratricopeptide (TPR) repeat protein